MATLRRDGEQKHFRCESTEVGQERPKQEVVPEMSEKAAGDTAEKPLTVRDLLEPL